MKTGLQRPFECAAQVSVLQAPMPETPHAWRVGHDQITALVSAFTRPTDVFPSAHSCVFCMYRGIFFRFGCGRRCGNLRALLVCVHSRSWRNRPCYSARQ